MAHKKAGGSKARQGSNLIGKRLGVKIYAGQSVSPGQVIIRQKGSVFHAGEGVGVGRDFTLFAVRKGAVSFRDRMGKRLVEVKSAER
ncbi:MAG: 50S ribosomal protein L27 [Candidatus Woykebacteria bacterium GWB1_45_5]|uniref:Large ribosomal subunit protein bL27 n=2 Tax=Candidatus Woykeibacteriota TaxID=1817899 RepID=A0A1G1W1X6_9BACT|nr:MAG: 50S ribosomal protein L27 [Candidatus Woykebacteria bacterium GWA1_44_8]OGY23581.1 MAG: 50S ribosomal protein L27 [Candidatus Woykebacteria bacterium GWB1_45_5]